ncbi:MAG TPA: Fic family protein, partial [Bryobacteraceae bacterium]|nr:Fic family protein [Bryobacteraceae bacterium]
DLPVDIAILVDPELDALRAMWQAEREHLDEAAVVLVSQELVREWAIETGIIENVYTLDRGITQTLIERGINAAYIPHDATNKDPELVARIIQTHADVLEGLFGFVKGERTLSTSYIKELHAALMRYQPTVTAFDQFDRPFDTELKRGEYKLLSNSPRTPDGSTQEYCPPEHVASEMDRMVALHAEHIERGIPPQLSAAWLHHAFTQIHPFQDGNGRVARALASLVFIKAGDFPLVVTRDQRTSYIDALEAADEGNIAALVGLFSFLQKRALYDAILKSTDTRDPKTIDDAIHLTRDLIIATGRVAPPKFANAKRVAGKLLESTSDAFGNISARLRREISTTSPQFQFQAATYEAHPQHEIAPLSTRFGYQANPEDYQQSMSLNLKSGALVSKIVLTLHTAGRRFSGLVVALAYIRTGEAPPVPICDDIFRISYAEPESSVVERYRGWLDACLIRGLAEWRRTLV